MIWQLKSWAISGKSLRNRKRTRQYEKRVRKKRKVSPTKLKLSGYIYHTRMNRLRDIPFSFERSEEKASHVKHARPKSTIESPRDI